MRERPAGEVAARITARPRQALGSVQVILSDARFDQLFKDRLFWTLIQNDSNDFAMNRNAIRSMVLDEDIRGRSADLAPCAAASTHDSRLRTHDAKHNTRHRNTCHQALSRW